MTAFFMVAIGLSNVLGNPLSGWIMDHFDGMNGLHGWQWLFVLEGLPTAVVGIAVLFYLDDSPRRRSLAIRHAARLADETYGRGRPSPPTAAWP